jgi:uncharacterized protein YecT (DUF1311 family)
MILRVAVLLVGLAGQGLAQDPGTGVGRGDAFSPVATEACLAAATADPAACIGHAADACMLETVGGETTVGMGECLRGELDWWQARLDAAHRAVAEAARSVDSEMRALGATLPPQAEAFAVAQAAWAAWRGAACDWERVQWGGGTGQGPATAACLMRITGERALELEAWLAEQARR